MASEFESVRCSNRFTTVPVFPMIYTHINARLTALLSLMVLLITPAKAQDVDTTEVSFGFDDVVEEPPPPASTSGGWTDYINVSGRFDVNLEVNNPAKTDDRRTSQIRTYHKFLFLNITPSEKVSLDAEVLDLSYYEVKYELPHGYEIKAGKIWVPFGATPFHHYYGASQGDPFQGLFLPNVWSEFGATIGGNLVSRGLWQIDADLYAIRGFESDLGSVIRFSNGGVDGTYAVGGRTRIGWDKVSVWGSLLYNQFGPGDTGELFLWGGDLLVDYGLVDVPILNDLKFRLAFARADIKDQVLVDPSFNEEGWYYRYGDYAEVSYRGINRFTPRVRYGTIVDYDDVVTNNDSHNTEFALLTRINRNLSILMQYQLNMEEVNEIDNDLFRFQLAFEF